MIVFIFRGVDHSDTISACFMDNISSFIGIVMSRGPFTSIGFTSLV